MQENTYEIAGKKYPVTAWEAVEGVGVFPVVDISMASDYRWMLGCLESRLQHPEHYEIREDMAVVIERIKLYLEENRERGIAEGLYQKYMMLIGEGA